MKFHGRILVAAVLVMPTVAAVLFDIVPAEVARQKNPLTLSPPYPVSIRLAHTGL